ncbi:hypothetical protein [Devosia nitrariae]|uniref:SGNH/GDSL hydrolase family protein n=1 Tax=Devosia nitrariae TaxID=2071872 RepID=A0ABQ5WE06_9HYPH|nr:hypothetical protein [Devosia nitrariae]GLQ57953.1 hypothetical protein GCM10010862_52120 [Devosia nitrariae]
MDELLNPSEVKASKNPPRRRALSRRSGGVAFIVTFAIGAIGTVLFAAAAIAALGAVDRLPAPPVNGTWCIDEKLAWMRANPELLESGVIAVGSSVTWRNLSFGEIPLKEREAVGGVANLAPCFLRINQTHELTNFLLDLSPGTHTVISVVAPRDFEACSTNATEFFDPELLESYLSGQVSEWWVYFRNLRAFTFIGDVIRLPDLSDQLVFEEFGSGPMFRDEPLLVGPARMEAACFDHLRRMATDLTSRGVKLVLVLFPFMPAWVESADSTGEQRAEFLTNVRSSLSGTGAVLVDATGMTFPNEDFADPLHLQWPVVPEFTGYIWERAFQGQGPAWSGYQRGASASIGRPGR